MARRQVISTGKDIASAIIRGLNELGRRRDQVDVTVLQKPSKGFFGIGAKKARVQIVEKAWDSEHSTPMRTGIRKRSNIAYNPNQKPRRTRRPRHLVEKTVTIREPKANETQKLPSMEIQKAIVPDNLKQPMEDAKITLNEILNKMGVKVSKLNAWWDAKQERILLTFDCDFPALVIGKEAKTLQSLQYLITLIISRSFSSPISVVSDTQNYWNKIEEKLNKDIAYALMTIRRNKRPYRFRPMPAQMRRYIHHFLSEEQDIITVSEGEGKWRKVVIKIATPQEKAAHIAAEKAAQERAAVENQTTVLEQTQCVLTAESTNCPVENLANTTPETTTQETTPAVENTATPTVETAPAAEQNATQEATKQETPSQDVSSQEPAPQEQVAQEQKQEEIK